MNYDELARKLEKAEEQLSRVHGLIAQAQEYGRYFAFLEMSDKLKEMADAAQRVYLRSERDSSDETEYFRGQADSLRYAQFSIYSVMEKKDPP